MTSRVFAQILKARGLSDNEARAAFLTPRYEARHDPFLLPDMTLAVERLERAHKQQEKITIYGDYDIDGLTATTVLLDAFERFGFRHVEAFIPNRFIEGYGLTIDAIEKIAASGAQLIITVDCGSLSEKEIIRASELGVDVIVTDHHNVAPVQPPAVAVINPKRLLMEYPEVYDDFVLKGEFLTPSSSNVIASQCDASSSESMSTAELAAPRQSSPSQESAKASSKNGIEKPRQLYPFLDLPGVGVAFKLVQALQTRLDGLPVGQEKWLLDLVALGTVCDVVTLQDENRAHVYWGLKVLAKTRRPGLKALMAVAGVRPETVTARQLGFGLGPRMNAAGRLETAQYALDMLRSREGVSALEKAQLLDDMNKARRTEQDTILEEAIVEAEQWIDDPVLVVSGKGWNHGIIGIVAAKLLEKYKKPTFVLEEMPRQQGVPTAPQKSEQDSCSTSKSQWRGEPLLSKGSARSYGDFSAADAIRAADDLVVKGGGHKAAAGVTLPTENIAAFRTRVNEFYRTQKLFNQADLLLPNADADVQISELDTPLVTEISQLEPFGNGNPQPVLRSDHLLVKSVRRMGGNGQHVKLSLAQGETTMDFLAFSAPEHFFVEPSEIVTVWYTPEINEWRGKRSIEGRLLHLVIVD